MTIGRVVVPLASITAGTIYDAWLPLHRSSDMLNLGRMGHLRLRYSVTFSSEAKRMLMYPLDSPRTFVLPFLDREALHMAKFTVRGFDADDIYSFDKLTDHVDEAKEHLQWLLGAREVARGILYWRWPHTMLSLLICIGVQLLISEPSWTLSILPFVGIITLHYTYAAAPPQPKIVQQPKPWMVLKDVFTNSAPTPLTVRPDPKAAREAIIASHGCSFFDEAFNAFDRLADSTIDSLNDGVGETLYNVAAGSISVVTDTASAAVDLAEDAAEAVADTVTDTASSAFTLFISEEAAAQKKARQIAQLRAAYARVQQRVDDAVDDALDDDRGDDDELTLRLLSRAGADLPDDDDHDEAAADGQGGAEAPQKSSLAQGYDKVSERAKGVLGLGVGDGENTPTRRGLSANAARVLNAANPLVPFLQPLQQQIGHSLRLVRMVRRIINWRDRRLTLWLYLSLWALAVLLFALIEFMPWGLFGPWILRLAGFSVTGPHMFFVGRYFQVRAPSLRQSTPFSQISDRTLFASAACSHHLRVVGLAGEDRGGGAHRRRVRRG